MIPPSFVNMPETSRLLTVGEMSTWSLPEIDEGDQGLSQVIIEIDEELSDFLSYDDKRRQFEFTDDLASEELLEDGQQFYSIKVRLVNARGDEAQVYTTTI